MAAPLKFPAPLPLAGFRNDEARVELTARYRENQALWPVPFEEKRVKTSFGVTNMMISGKKENPPLVLLHGFLNTPLMWRFNIEDLSRDYRVYMPETLGDAGLSRNRSIALRPNHWSEWLVELYGKLGIESSPLAGFSLGGWHAARFALHHPDRVESLVLLSPVPVFRVVPVSLIREAVAILLTEKRPEIRRLIGKQYAAQFYPDKPYELLQYAAFTCYLPLLPVFPRELSGGEWKQLAGKTLVIAGDEDIYYDPSDAEKLALRYLSRDRFVLLEETGHTLSIERPGLVSRLLLDFIESARLTGRDIKE